MAVDRDTGPSTEGATPSAHSAKTLLAYGALRMPLALLELPLFLFVPTLYGKHFGLSLTLIAVILFATRFVDAFADPIFGAIVTAKRATVSYRKWILLGMPILALGFVILLKPNPQWAPLAVWLVIGSLITYFAYSLVSIAYQSWGADISRDAVDGARITGVREAFGLVGVICAAALLRVETVSYLVALFICLSIIGMLALNIAPTPSVQVNQPRKSMKSLLASLWLDWRFRRLMVVFLLNGIATAIPATLVLFFLKDVLMVSDDMAPRFLLAYFVAGALGMPFWVWTAKRIGLEASWLIGMVFAVIAFAWTVGLGPGDSNQFMIVCIVTGLALGADLAMPPAILATVIKAGGRGNSEEASYFGVWNFAIKFNLAAAAAIALPLVEWGGYSPGGTGHTLALSLTYAALPCALKLIAGMLLCIRPIQQDGRTA